MTRVFNVLEILLGYVREVVRLEDKRVNCFLRTQKLNGKHPEVYAVYAKQSKNVSQGPKGT